MTLNMGMTVLHCKISRFRYVYASYAVSDWLAWGPWSSCSKLCDTGSQVRERNCTVPGKCGGDPSEERLCNEHPCKKGKTKYQN